MNFTVEARNIIKHAAKRNDPQNLDDEVIVKLIEDIEELLASRDSRSLSAVPSEITTDEVVKLNEMQRSNTVHPYTCGNRDNHPVFDGDRGVLVATIHGWICPFCDYKQPIKRGIAG